MSRIGKQPIPVPAGTEVKIKDQHITVKGSKGLLERVVHQEVEVSLSGDQLNITNRTQSKKVGALRGLTRSLINNMVVGVTEGFKKTMIIEGIGYKANISGTKLTLNVGYSNPVEFVLPENVSAQVEGNNKIILESIDKELLGLTASKIRAVRKPEPYKGKGIRYEDEHIIRKAGKAGAGG